MLFADSVAGSGRADPAGGALSGTYPNPAIKAALDPDAILNPGAVI